MGKVIFFSSRNCLTLGDGIWQWLPMTVKPLDWNFYCNSCRCGMLAMQGGLRGRARLGKT